jgi:NAD(P)-dependent dehydrogenase (short-subunit alcohol dehydrogenase family)
MSILKQFELNGKKALVTGCKRGIGKAMSLALAEAGADIVGVSATLETEGSKVEQEVKALGRSFQGYQADFANRKKRLKKITRLLISWFVMQERSYVNRQPNIPMNIGIL